MGWTDERVELLKKLWADGLSASQIAAELGGITRNAVIGKVHRLGLSGRAKSPSSSSPRPRKARSSGMMRIPRASIPTIATCVFPSSNTAARTLHGSCSDRWYDFPYPPGASIPISGVISRSANPALKTGPVGLASSPPLRLENTIRKREKPKIRIRRVMACSLSKILLGAGRRAALTPKLGWPDRRAKAATKG